MLKSCLLPGFAFLLLGCEDRLKPAPADTDDVRLLLQGQEFHGYAKLRQMAERAFPTFDEILSDPKAMAEDVARIFAVLRDLNADRQRFLEHTVRRLADPDGDVRCRAVRVLEQIGSGADASPAVALLSDSEKRASYAAAKALVTIGGERELIAMDAWLQGASHRDDAHLRQHVKECRDTLKARLDKSKT